MRRLSIALRSSARPSEPPLEEQLVALLADVHKSATALVLTSKVHGLAMDWLGRQEPKPTSRFELYQAVTSP